MAVKTGENDLVGGIREGIARGVSQAVVFGIEARKSMLQVYGCSGVSKIITCKPEKLFRNMMESAISSGLVFGFYFTTYNSIGMTNPLAGPISSFMTSLVKIPISNGMRMIHVNKAPHLFAATKKIVRCQGIRGLYNGYTLSLVEDMIEFDMRARAYSSIKTEDNIALNIGFGAIIGMLSAYITTPFDTIRANMSVTRNSAWDIACTIFKKDGIPGLYKGGHLRMYSNFVKYSMFFMMFEVLSAAQNNKSYQSRV